MKKRVLVVLLALAVVIAMLAGCGKEDKDDAGTEADAEAETGEDAGEEAHDATPINIVALKGPTAMGMIEMMSKTEDGTLDGHEYSFQLLAAPDEVAPLIIQGKADIAAVPANLASVIFNKTEGGVQVINVNTLGVIYIVEKGESITGVADLKGKTIYASGQGATPEYALRFIFSENGIDPDSDVTIEWKSEHAECLSALMESEDAIAMLPQPFVTTAMTKAEGLRVALDLTEEWDKTKAGSEQGSQLITGVTIVRKEFAEEHPEAVDDFLAHYAESVEFVNASVAEAAQMIERFDIVPAAVAEKAIPECNIVCVTGGAMKDALSGYLGVLAEQNPQAVGGQVPTDDFYYISE